jgi:hypothetical protein
MNTLKGKRLCLHFDGKQMKQIEDDLDITVTVERIDTSVSHHLTLGIQMTFYLELFRRLPKALIKLMLS